MAATEHPAARLDPPLLAAFDALATPEGFRAELIEGEIVVTPPPDGEHETGISSIARQFFRHSAEEVDVLGNKGLRVPAGRFIPDGTVVPAGHFRGAEPWAPADGVLLVFEVTSGRAARDRDAKRLGYAAAGIPLFLLLDHADSRATLFSDPKDGDYTTLAQVAFGTPLPLPDPFAFPLTTTAFA